MGVIRTYDALRLQALKFKACLKAIVEEQDRFPDHQSDQRTKHELYTGSRLPYLGQTRKTHRQRNAR